MGEGRVKGLQEAWGAACARGDEVGMDRASRAIERAVRLEQARRASSAHVRVAKRIADSILKKVAS